MKNRKGKEGYIRRRKISLFIKTILEFSIVIALLILGIWQTGDRLNLLTVVAILGCLPASKALVELIMILPHHSVPSEMSMEIDMQGSHITKIYDMVFTSEKNVMPVDSVVICGNTICGYTSNSKVNTTMVAEHIKKYLLANQFQKVSVKIFNNYQTYMGRVKEMDRLAQTEEHETKDMEAGICRVLLSLSL